MSYWADRFESGSEVLRAERDEQRWQQWHPDRNIWPIVPASAEGQR